MAPKTTHFGNINQMITLTVIKLSVSHCVASFVGFRTDTCLCLFGALLLILRDVLYVLCEQMSLFLLKSPVSHLGIMELLVVCHGKTKYRSPSLFAGVKFLTNLKPQIPKLLF